MSTLTATARYSPEDLLRMPDGDQYELVAGQLVERNMSFWSSFVAGETFGRLRDYCRAGHPGWLVPEGTSYQCFPHAPNKVRRADVSFIKAERLSLVQATEEGHLSIFPDLAVEVLSPNDLAYEVNAKVQDFLRAGVLLVWIIEPRMRTVQVYRPTGQAANLGENDELTGEDVLPGFRCRVGDLFLPPAGVQPSP